MTDPMKPSSILETSNQAKQFTHTRVILIMGPLPVVGKYKVIKRIISIIIQNFFFSLQVNIEVTSNPVMLIEVEYYSSK